MNPGRVAALSVAALLAWPALAGEVAAGRAKANACAVCHGPMGLATLPDAPNLAGQSALYLAAQLKAYRAGTRRHEVMSLMAKTLSDADIDDLASWYSSLKVRVDPVP
ncbi:c-type cytochrome [Caenimonas terrae]|uniref:C-type cytochrome n=1 Tax=Caenimonas terrae TaxID=696074 RepID=A0ABW0NAV5_9BURK